MALSGFSGLLPENGHECRAEGSYRFDVYQWRSVLWGGVALRRYKSSGIGRQGGIEGMEQYLETKAVGCEFPLMQA
jgi:hypothetical protein